MNLTIPDDVLGGVLLTSDDARLEIAVGLFAKGRVSVARGARIAGLPFLEFQRELGSRQIAMHYDIADYEQDMTVLKNAGEL